MPPVVAGDADRDPREKVVYDRRANECGISVARSQYIPDSASGRTYGPLCDGKTSRERRSAMLRACSNASDSCSQSCSPRYARATTS